MDLRPILKPYLKGELVTIWTICPVTSWEHFQKVGLIKADGRRAMKSYREAYHWLIEQMVKKIPGHKPGQFPTWAWYYPRPDLRHIAHLATGTKGILLTCKVPGQRMLLSDFGAWHHVLNQWYLPLTKEEDDAADEEERGWYKLPNISQKYWQLRLEKNMPSWQRIFDLQALNKSKLLGPVEQIQATVSYIRLDEVVKVTPFTAR